MIHDIIKLKKERDLMRKTMIQTIEQMFYNRKSLFLFEIIYRTIGIVVIYPIAKIIFYFSITVSEYTYVTNELFIKYLTRPSTISLFLILAVLLGIYIVIEFIFLALLFDLGYHKQKVSFRTFIFLGMKRVGTSIKRYHIFILIPAFALLFFVQLINFTGIASTIEIPGYIINQLNQNSIFSILIYTFLFISLIVFLESIFSIHLFSIDQHSVKSAFFQSRKMLKGQRLKIFFEFGFINLILNLALYLIYFIIIGLIGLFIWLIVGQDEILGYVLSLLYTVYLVLGLFATTILIPVNFSLITTWYYQYKEKHGLVKRDALLVRMNTKPMNFKWVKRGSIIFLIILSALNITTIFAIVNPESRFEMLNRTEVIAHRGSSLYAPENTLASIDLAITQGADAIEFDVRLTKDGIPILFHDETIKRTTTATTSIRIKDLTLEEIKLLNAGSWFSEEFASETIPTLEEALTLIDHRIHIFVELKVTSTELEQKTVELIEEHQMIDQTTFISTNRSQLEHIKQINPDYQTLLLISSYYGNQETLVNFWDVDSYGFERKFIQSHPELIDLIHEKEKKAYVWTVNNPTYMEELMNIDIDGIITDDPIAAREIIYTEHTQDLYVDLLRRLFKRNSA